MITFYMSSFSIMAAGSHTCWYRMVNKAIRTIPVVGTWGDDTLYKLRAAACNALEGWYYQRAGADPIGPFETEDMAIAHTEGEVVT